MNLKARKGYKALALALLVFSTSIASSGYKIHLEYGRITKKFLPSLWSAAQAEIELLRLLDALNRFVREDAPTDSFGCGNRSSPPAFEDRAENEIVDRCPAGIGLGDRRFVEPPRR